MNQIFNDSFLRGLNTYLLPVAVIWSLSSVGGVFLSKTAVEGYADRYDSFFELFRFGDVFALPEYVPGGKQGKTITKTSLIPVPYEIKAIFRSPSDSFVTIDDAKVTSIVPLRGTYKKEFRLIGLNDHAAIFEGHGKTYRLRLGFKDTLEREETIRVSVDDTNEKGENEWRTLEHAQLIERMNDIQNLIKTIEINEVRDSGKISGFRVDHISADSLFARLGIVQGDVIQSVNNKHLGSYADVFGVYNQVPHMKSIKITVLRNNQPKDLLYEITR